MLLCDAAQVADGKLYILGGGWSMTGPDPVPSAVALKIDEAAATTALPVAIADHSPVSASNNELPAKAAARSGPGSKGAGAATRSCCSR